MVFDRLDPALASGLLIAARDEADVAGRWSSLRQPTEGDERADDPAAEVVIRSARIEPTVRAGGERVGRALPPSELLGGHRHDVVMGEDDDRLGGPDMEVGDDVGTGDPVPLPGDIPATTGS